MIIEVVFMGSLIKWSTIGGIAYQVVNDRGSVEKDNDRLFASSIVLFSNKRREGDHRKVRDHFPRREELDQTR